MKEKEFFKEVMKRGFEPDLESLSDKILARSDNKKPEPPAVGRKAIPGFIAGAAAAAVVAAGLLIGFRSFGKFGTDSSGSTGRSAEDIAPSAVTTTSPESSDSAADLPGERFVPSEKPYIYLNGYHSYEYLDKLHIPLTGENDAPPIPELFEFVGVVTENVSREESYRSASKHRLQSNDFPVGASVFYNKYNGMFIGWTQQLSSYGWMYITDNETDFVRMYGKEATDTGRSVESGGYRRCLYEAVRLTVSEIVSEEEFTAVIDRTTLLDTYDQNIPETVTVSMIPAGLNGIELPEGVTVSVKDLSPGQQVWLPIHSSLPNAVNMGETEGSISDHIYASMVDTRDYISVSYEDDPLFRYYRT